MFTKLDASICLEVYYTKYYLLYQIVLLCLISYTMSPPSRIHACHHPPSFPHLTHL